MVGRCRRIPIRPTLIRMPENTSFCSRESTVFRIAALIPVSAVHPQLKTRTWTRKSPHLLQVRLPSYDVSTAVSALFFPWNVSALPSRMNFVMPCD